MTGYLRFPPKPIVVDPQDPSCTVNNPLTDYLDTIYTQKSYGGVLFVGATPKVERSGKLLPLPNFNSMDDEEFMEYMTALGMDKFEDGTIYKYTHLYEANPETAETVYYRVSIRRTEKKFGIAVRHDTRRQENMDS